MAKSQLVRNKEEGQIAGVCAGLADYSGVDVTIIRALFVILFLTGSSGLWAYLILWLVMPPGDEVKTVVVDAEKAPAV